MASLNWVQLSTNPTTGRSTPVPLPTERPLIAPLRSVQISLYPSIATSSDPPKSAPVLSTTGTIYLSTTRIVFVRDGATASNPHGSETDETSSLSNGSASIVRPSGTMNGGGGSSGSGTMRNSVLNTLSMPFTHFIDGKFVQPFFGMAYYQARIIPAEFGGLEQCVVKIGFKESGGAAFYEQVEAMKSLVVPFDRVVQHVEPLPLYVPPPAPLIDVPTPSGYSIPSQQRAAPTATTGGDNFVYDRDAIPLLNLSSASAAGAREAPPDYYGENR